MHHNTPRLSREDNEDEIARTWQDFIELIVEAMEESLKKGQWIPGKGLVGVDDTLDETFVRDQNEGKGSKSSKV